MRIRSFLFGIACLFATISHAQTASVTAGCAPLTVDFTPPSGTATYFWDFNDGTTSPKATPTYIFVNPGTYNVKFFAVAGGAQIGNTITIDVGAKPVPVMTASGPLKGCLPFKVDLNATVKLPDPVKVTSYKWVYGDGSGGTPSPNSNTTKTYTNPGVWEVSVEITTNSPSCNVTKQFSTQKISVSFPPSVSVATTPSPATACTPPLLVSFINNSNSSLPLTYQWKLPNGTTVTGPTLSPINITTIGSYTVTLKATDTNSCSDSTKVSINVGKPTASFKVRDTVCINTPVSFTNGSSAGAYTWDFGSGASPANSGATNPIVTYSTPGVKTVKLHVAAGVCSSDSIRTIVVDDPKISFTATPVYSCSEPVKVAFNSTSISPIISWNWNFGDKKAGTSTLEDPNYTYVIDDSAYSKRGINVFKVTLNATTAAGCKVSATKNDTIYLVWARFVPDLYQGCAPLTVTFSDSSKSDMIKEPLDNWFWDYGDGKKDTATNKGPKQHTYTTPGLYNVQLIVKSKNGCRDTSYKVAIKVGITKPVSFTMNPTNLCPGDSVTFTNTTPDKTGFTGWHYSSSGELLSHCFWNDHPVIKFDNITGPQDIILTGDYNGCPSVSAKQTITVNGPIARFESHQSCDKKFEVKFTNTSGDAKKVIWNFGDGTPPVDSLGPVITHQYAKTGDYKVVITAQNPACKDSKDSATVHIRDIQAKFTTDQLLCIGASYKFDASTSVDVYPHCYTGYTWEFSDPDKRPISSTDPASGIIFTKNGKQTVTLIVEDINGCKDTASTNIKVFTIKPDYSIVKSTICLPATVAFNPAATTSDTTIVTWDWNFGDGSLPVSMPGNSNGDTTHLYTSATSPLNVNLIITDRLGCKDTLKKPILIYTPTSKITVSPNTNICLGTPLTFTADDYTVQGSNLQFNWTMGDGTGTSAVKSFPYTYTKSGTFTVTLNYKENGSGCPGQLTQQINVQDYPVAHFTTNVDNQIALCFPKAIDFTDSSIVSPNSPVTSYFWNLGNGLTQTSNKASATYQKGTYTVTLIVKTSFGCADTVKKNYKVVGPEGKYTVAPTTPVCRGEAVTFTVFDLLDVDTYTWQFGDGSSETDKSPVKHTYSYVPPSGKTTASLILYDKNKICSTPIKFDVFIQSVKADFAALDTTVCFKQNAVLINKSLNGSTYSWDLGDNSTSAAKDTVRHLYPTPGSYMITLITKSASLGCSDTTKHPLTVLALPAVQTQGDTVCPNTLAHLSANPNTPGFTYHWTPITGLSNANIYNPVLTPSVSQTYTVQVTDLNSCSTIDTARINVLPTIMDIDFDTLIVVGDIVHLPIDNKGGTILFTWTPTTGLSCQQCTGPAVQPLKDIVYNVHMEDFLGCSDANGRFRIRIKPVTFIKVPTTFTPNGDGSNDIIYVKGWGIKDLVSFQIYNRWGELVFETSELSEGWNGFYKDMLQNNDIYTYKVKAIDYFDQPMEAEGHINLMR